MTGSKVGWRRFPLAMSWGIVHRGAALAIDVLCGNTLEAT
ncbi:hypothetical protein MVUOKPPV_CDS0144 [Klebsiella phage phi1_175008]|uniref:Uncharacterized protein n=1 Tax=Klebsiella phage phi1_175008 TaxID=3127744 RepID=A0ACD5FRK8_9CAUD